MNNSNPQNKLFKILGEIPTELSNEQVELLISGFPDNPITEKSWLNWFSLNTMLMILGSVSVLIFGIFSFSKNDGTIANFIFMNGESEAVLKNSIPVLTDTLEEQPKVNQAHASTSYTNDQVYDKHSRQHGHESSASTQSTNKQSHGGSANSHENGVTFQEEFRYDTTYTYTSDSLGNVVDSLMNIARIPLNKNFASHASDHHQDASYQEEGVSWRNIIQVTIFSICCFFFGRLMVKSFIHR